MTSMETSSEHEFQRPGSSLRQALRYLIVTVFFFPFFFLTMKREISLIQNDNILHMNTEIKMLKTLEDNTASRLIERRNGSRPTSLVILDA